MDSEIYGILSVSVMQPLIGISSLRYISVCHLMLFMAGSFIVNFAFCLFGTFGSSWVFFWRVKGFFFNLKRSWGYCGVMQYGHLNQFITWQVHCDQGTETSNL